MKNCSKLIFAMTGLIAGTSNNAIAETGEDQSRMSSLLDIVNSAISRLIGSSFIAPFWFAVFMAIVSIMITANVYDFRVGKSLGQQIVDGLIYAIIVAFLSFTAACFCQWLLVPGSFK
jgi:hypothetical protein